MNKAALPLVLVLLALVAGCASPENDPKKAFQVFVDRVQVRDLDAAWAMLSKGTQDTLTTLVKQKSAESQGAIPDDPKQVIFGNASLARPIQAIDVKERSDTRAVLEVTAKDGSKQEIVLVREAGAWKVDIQLPAAAG